MSKWKAGAKKHGGLLKAALVQINKWEQSAEEHARQAREAEERERLEQEQIRRALELSKKAEEELAAQKLAEEAEEQRERLEQEQIKQTLEFSQKQAEELEQLRLAEKLSKESFEKSQRGKIINFLRSPDDVSDDVALPALDIVKRWESTNEELIEKLHGFGDKALDKFLNVEIVGKSQSKEPEERVKELVIKAEEIPKLERELEVLEVSKKYVKSVKEFVEQQLAKEAEERRKLMQEKIREDLESYKNPVRELGLLKTSGELSKESFEKLTCAFVGSSIEKDISDKHSITDLLKEGELNNKQLFEVLDPYDNQVLDTFVCLEASGELASEEI
jgi:esterase/lipase